MRDGLRPLLLLWLAQACLVFGMKARALDALRRLVAEYPRQRRAWGILGFLHADAGRLDEALAAFDRVLEIEPGHPDTIFNAAYVMQKARRHEEAITRFQQVLDRNRFMDRAWYGMGLSLAALGRHEEAVEKLREAVRLQPFNPYAGYQLAAALHKLGRHEEVRSEYERVRGFEPKIAAQMRRDLGVSGPP